MLRLRTAITFLLVTVLGAAPDSRADGLEGRVAIPVENDRDGLRPLPLAGPFELRPGVRVDYQNHPSEDAWELDGTPMLGVRVRF
jgi:hypothetical protein